MEKRAQKLKHWKDVPEPTAKELAILRLLWRLGPSSVRQVHAELSKGEDTGYTTTLKLMQIMAEKGLAIRDASQRTHIYEAGVAEEVAQKRFVADLLDRVFNGSAKQLVVQALACEKTSDQERAEIKKLLDDLERKRK